MKFSSALVVHPLFWHSPKHALQKMLYVSRLREERIEQTNKFGKRKVSSISLLQDFSEHLMRILIVDCKERVEYALLFNSFMYSLIQLILLECLFSVNHCYRCSKESISKAQGVWIVVGYYIGLESSGKNS